VEKEMFKSIGGKMLLGGNGPDHGVLKKHSLPQSWRAIRSLDTTIA